MRGGGVGDGPAQRQIRQVALRLPGREQRRMPALRVPGDQVALADPRVEIPGGADDVEHAAPLGLADQVRVGSGGAEALVVGAQHGVAGLQPGVQLGVDVGDVGPRRVALAVARGGADVGGARGAVREGDHRPAVLGRLALRHADRSRDRGAPALRGEGGVEDEAGRGGLRQRHEAVRLARPDQVAVPARELLRRVVEGQPRRSGSDLGGGAPGERRSEDGECGEENCDSDAGRRGPSSSLLAWGTGLTLELRTAPGSSCLNTPPGDSERPGTRAERKVRAPMGTERAVRRRGGGRGGRSLGGLRAAGATGRGSPRRRGSSSRA